MHSTLGVKVHYVRDDLPTWDKTPLELAGIAGKNITQAPVHGGTNDLVVCVLQAEWSGVSGSSGNEFSIQGILSLWDEAHDGVVKLNRHAKPIHDVARHKHEGKSTTVS